MNSHSLKLLFWETTVGCNLRCSHCRASAKPGRAADEITTAQAFSFLSELARFASPILILSGGEPLYRPDILDISAHAAQRGLRVALATNGTLVDAKMAHAIRKAGIQRVSISIDGVNGEVHDGFRGVAGAFDAALDGARFLRQAGVPVQFNTTVTRHNIASLQDIVALAEREKAVALHLFLLVPVGCGLEVAKTDQISAGEYEAVLDWFYSVSKKTEMELRATCAPHYYRVIRQKAREEGRKVTPKSHGMAAMTRGCLAGSSVCFVSFRGDVFPCGYFPVSAGNVLETPLRKIWEDAPLFQKLRDVDRLEGKCGICEFRKVCGGCRARAYGMTGNFLGEEPLCIYEPAGNRVPA